MDANEHESTAFVALNPELGPKSAVACILCLSGESIWVSLLTGDQMPLVRISLIAGKPESYRQKISDVVHRAMVETVNVPAQDRFQIITEHSKNDFVYDAQYLNIPRTDDLVIIQITLNAGRTTELKKALYRRIADLLNQEAGIRKEDVFINLVEVSKENWSFGNGEAQYAT